MPAHRQAIPGFSAPSHTGKGTARPRPVGAFRNFLVLLLVAVAGLSLADGRDLPEVEQSVAGDLPDFLFQPLYASNQGEVYGIYAARHADLVLIQGGFNSGFQPGMLCRVLDREGEVGEVMLVEVRNNCSAALILHLEAGKVIEPAHSVRIKTVTF
jgi:hypothetical protein